MPLIEGLGDEVTLVLGAFVLCVVLMLAWFSTHTSEIPLLREVGVIVVELSQRRNRATPAADSRERSSPEGEDNSTAVGSDGVAGQEAASTSEQTDVGESTTPQETAERSAASSTHRDGSDVDVAPAGADGKSSLSPSSPVEGSKPAQSGSAKASIPLPEVAEQVTVEQERQHRADGGRVDGEREESGLGENVLENTDSPIPTASTVVDESGKPTDLELPDHPNDEEIRRRRVQYFQTSAQSGVTSDTVGDFQGGESGVASVQTSASASTDVSNVPTPLSYHHCDSTDAARQRPTNSSPTFSAQSDAGERLASLPGGGSEPSETGGQVASDFVWSNTMGVAEHVASETSSGSPDSLPSSQIRVKLKYMNETQRLVYASPMDTIGDFRRTHFQPELEENKWVRFIYNGQDLRDDARTLQACNVGDNCTMHCLITAQTRPSVARDVGGDEEGEDSVLGALMYPLFTLVLLVVWYFRFTYRQYFSAMSTVCLIGISFLLALSYISSLRSNDTVQQQQQQPAAAGGRQQQEHPHAD